MRGLIAGIWLMSAALLTACPQERISEEKREIWVDGVKVADVSEIVRKSRTEGELVQRRHLLIADPREAILTNVSLDAQGFALGASYRREGAKGKRYVELTRKEGKTIVFSRGDDETLLLPDVPVVLLETLHRLRAEKQTDVVLLDIENAVALPARLDDKGVLRWPSGTPVTAVVGGRVDLAAGTPLPPPSPATWVAPEATAADPVLPVHTSRAPFLESKTKLVTTWCRAQGLGAGAEDAARAVALAAKPKLANERAGGPPSALMAVQIGGGDEAGAALVVACLRALEHPARVVSGHVGNDTSFRTWAQVHDGKTWNDVDPLDIDLNGAAALPHRARVEGFRGPLTTGLLAR